MTSLVTDHFFWVWTTVGLVVVSVALLFNGKVSIAHGPGEEPEVRRGPVSLYAVGAFIAFVAGYCWLILYEENFAMFDNHLLTQWSLRGVDHPPPIWASAGRFFPLAFQEFNLLRHFTTSPTGFHLFGIAQLMITLFAVTSILARFPMWVRLGIATFLMLAPSVMTSFSGFIIPERNIVFWLAVFLFAYKRFDRSRSPYFAVMAVIAAHFALYYKEPVFVLLSALSGGRLLFSFVTERHAMRSGGYRHLARRHSLDLSILLLSVAFLALYAIAVLPQTDFAYAKENSVGRLASLGYYLRFHPWIGLLFVTLIGRSIHLLVAKKRPDPFWDSLAAGAALFTLAYVFLGLFSEYYVAPADFVAVLYLGRLASIGLSSRHRLHHVALGIVAALILVHEVSHSFWHLVERKGFISSHVRLSTFLEDRSDTSQMTLFAPYASAYRLMLASTFLDYRGLEPARPGHGEADFVFKSPLEFQSGRCVNFYPYGACDHAVEPRPGDWIVILPDDQVPREVLVDQVDRNEVLLHHAPQGQRLARKMMGWFGLSADDPMHPTPGAWMDLYILESR